MARHALVFGLSADPVHIGHVQLVKSAVDWLARHDCTPSRVLILPTGRSNPATEKKHAKAGFQHRYRQCRLAFDSLTPICPVQVLDTDWQRIMAGVKHNTSLDSLSALRASVLWREQVTMLLSADHFSGSSPAFFRWHRWQDLLKQCHWLIADRDGHHISAQTWHILKTHASVHRRIQRLSWDAPAAASRDIRRWLSHGDAEARKKAEALLPEAVSAYIRRHGLYGVPPAP